MYSLHSQRDRAQRKTQAWLAEEYRGFATELQRAWRTARDAISTAMAATGAEPGDLDAHLNDTFDALFGETWRKLRRRADDEGCDVTLMPWPVDVDREPAPLPVAAE